MTACCERERWSARWAKEARVPGGIAFDAEKAIPGGALGRVEDSIITAVEPGSAPALDGCEVTRLPGTTVLPGLIDTHSHLRGNSELGALDRLPGLNPAAAQIGGSGGSFPSTKVTLRDCAHGSRCWRCCARSGGVSGVG